MHLYSFLYIMIQSIYIFILNIYVIYMYHRKTSHSFQASIKHLQGLVMNLAAKEKTIKSSK